MKRQLPEGAKAKFWHERHTYNGIVQPRGGTTIARIVLPDETILAEAQAHCSERDNYCKQIGRDIALGRALKQLDGKAAVV